MALDPLLSRILSFATFCTSATAALILDPSLPPKDNPLQLGVHYIITDLRFAGSQSYVSANWTFQLHYSGPASRANPCDFPWCLDVGPATHVVAPHPELREFAANGFVRGQGPKTIVAGTGITQQPLDTPVRLNTPVHWPHGTIHNDVWSLEASIFTRDDEITGALITVAANHREPTVRGALVDPSQSAARGGQVSFSGTLENASESSIYLTELYVAMPGFGTSTLPFDRNAPYALEGHQSTTGALFIVSVPADIANGVYHGRLDIQGGSDPFDYGLLASVPFSVTVVPEPGTWALLGAGILVLGVHRRCHR